MMNMMIGKRSSLFKPSNPSQNPTYMNHHRAFLANQLDSLNLSPPVRSTCFRDVHALGKLLYDGWRLALQLPSNNPTISHLAIPSNHSIPYQPSPLNRQHLLIIIVGRLQCAILPLPLHSQATTMKLDGCSRRVDPIRC